MSAAVLTKAAFTNSAAEKIDFVQRARDLVPVLKQRSDRTIQERSVLPETIRDFREAGFLKLLLPKRYGGYEADFGIYTQVLEQLARGCGSSAWVACTLTEHSWFLSCLSEEAQDDIWGENPDACASASFSPKPVQATDGGYRVTGLWSFSSGCDHAQWAFLGAAAPTGMIFMVVPMSDITIVDDWHAIGLRGTGSKSLRLTDVFVPAYRTVAMMDLMRGAGPGRAVHPDYYLCRTPQQVLGPYSLPSVVLGLAQRALDHFIDSLVGKKLPGGALAIEQQMAQFAAAEGAAEIETVRMRIREQCRDVVDRARAGEFTLQTEALFGARRDFSVMTQRLLHVVLKLCSLSGSRWVYENEPMQLILRDIITASAHNGALPSSVMNSGREMFGLPAVFA